MQNTIALQPDEVFSSMKGAAFFYKMDLKTGFHQIGFKKWNIQKAVLNTKYEKFKYHFMLL